MFFCFGRRDNCHFLFGSEQVNVIRTLFWHHPSSKWNRKNDDDDDDDDARVSSNLRRHVPIFLQISKILQLKFEMWKNWLTRKKMFLNSSPEFFLHYFFGFNRAIGWEKVNLLTYRPRAAWYWIRSLSWFSNWLTLATVYYWLSIANWMMVR